MRTNRTPESRRRSLIARWGLLGVLIVVVALVLRAVVASKRTSRPASPASRPLVAVPSAAVAAPAPAPGASAVPAKAGRVVRRLTARTALTSTAAVLIGVLVAAAGASGSYALWNSTAAITDTAITSGSLGLTVKYGTDPAGATAAIPATAWSNLLPGDSVRQQLTVASTGSAKSAVTARLSAVTAGVEIRVALGACTATPLAGAVLTTTAAALGDFTAAASSPVCVQVTLPTTSADVQGQSVAFGIVFDATQKASN